MKRLAFFPGCLIPARHPAMEFAIRHTLKRLDVDVVDLPGASCCPDPIYFKSKDKVAWLSVAARNLCLAEDMGLDIFTNCSGCTATLSETYHLLQDLELRATGQPTPGADRAHVPRHHRGAARRHAGPGRGRLRRGPRLGGAPARRGSRWRSTTAATC